MYLDQCAFMPLENRCVKHLPLVEVGVFSIEMEASQDFIFLRGFVFLLSYSADVSLSAVTFPSPDKSISSPR